MQVLRWVKFSQDFLADAEPRDASLKSLNEYLGERAVLLGGLKTSEADIVVFSTVHSFVVCSFIMSRFFGKIGLNPCIE